MKTCFSNKVVKQVDEELKTLGFPFEGDMAKTVGKDLPELKELLTILDTVDLPSHLRHDDPPLPIKTLLAQLKKKFHYFFYSSSSKVKFSLENIL